MLDPFTLNVTLPPFMYNGAVTTETKPPVVSATYTTDQYLKLLASRNSQFQQNMEDVNKASMSGRPALTGAMVAKAQGFAGAYHANVRNSYTPQQAQPLVGMDRTMSLKSATQKLMREE